MKKEIFAGGAGFTAFSSVPLVADDANAYEIVYTAPEDLSGTTFEITALRADGEKIVDSGEVSGSTARYLMKNSMHAVVGDLRVRLSVLDASGACLTTKELVFEVIEGNGTGDVTADTNYPILTELIVDMRKAISDSEAVLNDLQGEISDLHTYADSKADAALASAKWYADTKDGENLTAAKTYTDTKDAENLSAAKTYADGKDAETLESAKSYTDEKNKAEITLRVHFGDIGSLPGATVGISRIKFYANGYPTIESGSPLSVSIYNGSAFLASVSAPVGFGGDDYLDCDAEGNVAVSWMRGNVQMQMLEADDFISKMAEADSVIINDSYAEMTYADVTYTATVSAKLDSEIERAKSAESEVLENAKSYADTKAAAAEENAKTYGNQTFAGALKGEKLGSIVRLDDVSALDRRLDTVVSSKNIIPFPYADGMSKTVNGVTFTVSDDGSITVNGTATSDVIIVISNNLYLEKGSYMLSGMPKIELSGKNNGGVLFLFEKSNEKFHLDYSAGAIVNIEQSGYVSANIKIYAGASVENVVVKPMLECGTSSTAYTKHVSDLSGVSLKKFGKNLFHCYGVSANSIENPGASCALSNTYGTTIDKTALSSASDVLTVTQTEHPNSTNLSSYTNGFFCIGLSDMIVGQNYTLSFTFNKTDDPLSAMTEFKLHAYLNGSKFVPWQKVSANRFSLSFTWEVSGARPDARYIEVRLSGMSGTFSAFQLEPLSTASAYVPWSAPTTYTVGADGAVQNLSANEDVTTLVTDNEGTVLKTKYSRDLNAAFAEIQNAIIALGGSF